MTFYDTGVEWADPTGLEKIGIWEDHGKIIAIVTYESKLGSAFILTAKGYEYLKEEMFIYAKDNFSIDNQFRVLIIDGDLFFQDIAAKYGFYPTQDKWSDLIFPIDLDKIEYKLPETYKITCLNENFDMYRYGQCLWKGFDHETKAEGPFYRYWEKHSEKYIKLWNRPNVDLSLKIFVEAPNGDFVSHCGMWYDKKSKTAIVEPVATEPAYRKKGLGKAAVLEGIKRCGILGAEKVFVGSPQQFYYNIGFRPYATSTWWKEKNSEKGQNSI
jgi:GNAT superfamily N-acetyltransferase